jgi:cytochrome c oxidase subunit 2
MVSRGGKLTRWGLAPLLVLLSALLFSGCDSNVPSFLNPSSTSSKTDADLFWIIFGIATVIFVAVTAVLLYSIVRFRERPGMPAPRQLHGNTQLEIAWTIVPSIVLLIVLIFTITYINALAEPANTPQTIHVKAIAHQWWWEFQYENADPAVITADELHIPVGTVVSVDLRSDNVIHSMWVPQLQGKTDVIPGHDNNLWLRADRAGNYRGECTEFCGTQHANMNFLVVAESQDAYSSWFQNEQLQAVAPTTDQQQRGRDLFLHQGCVACHNIAGVAAVGAKVGPNLTHFGSRQLIAGWVLDNNPENLAMWLANPQAVKSGSDMVLGQPLTPDQISDLVAYLESLK